MIYSQEFCIYNNPPKKHVYEKAILDNFVEILPLVKLQIVDLKTTPRVFPCELTNFL